MKSPVAVHRIFILSITIANVLAIAVPLVAEEGSDPIRVVPEGTHLSDPRLQLPKDLNGHFPFRVPDSSEDWALRRDELKQRVLVANGLWPMPKKTPLNSVIFGKSTREGFTVEKVYFESLPGHFVTGLLFRPEENASEAGQGNVKRPGVLSPHGHGGRQYEYSDSQMKQAMETGGEFLPMSGRFPKLARCAHLARMGCVVFIFDMLGYEDSQQISYELAHRYKAVRPNMEGLQNYGFFSGQAEGRLHSVMGLQTWNAIRALDFLESLPDVDSSRLAVTGGSGGGTQTILLGAIDDRPIASFPNGMVSTSMQGGCTCENCSLLRIGTGNVELAALFAPKPQGMTAAKDWTVDMMTDGYPELKQLYSMLGQPDHVLCEPLLQFPHNYNAVTRKIMYQFMKQHLQLDEDAPVDEVDWQPLLEKEHVVWDEDHPAPPSGIDYERKLMKQLANRDAAEMFDHVPTQEQLPRYLQTVRAGWETIIGRDIEDIGEISRAKSWKTQHDGYLVVGDLLTEEIVAEQLPVVSVYPTSGPWNEEVVLWFSGQGKVALFPDGQLHADAQKLIDAGYAVVSADLFGQGEFASNEGVTTNPLVKNPLVKNPRPFAGYTFGYNDTVFARRVHDVLKLVKWVQTVERKPSAVHAIAIEGAGPVVAVAGAVTKDSLNSFAIDTEGFRFSALADWKHVDFLPGAIKYGDIPTVLAMCAEHDCWIGGEPSLPAIVKTAGAVFRKQITAGRQSTKTNSSASSAVSWLIRSK